jgi:hypothetical protein
MGKCTWCEKSFEGGPFSNYCSKKCEKEAVNNGEKKGVSYNSGIGIIILIMIIFFSFKKFTTDKNQSKKENVENNYSTPNVLDEVNDEINIENISIDNPTPENETNTQNEIIQGDLPNTSSEDANSQEQNEKTKVTEETAIELLRDGKSVREVADSTGMSRQEVRKIKRHL